MSPAGAPYEAKNDEVSEGDTQSKSREEDYASRPGQKQESIPVQSDDADVDDPIDSTTANTNEQLARDDKDAIDQSNVIDGRTRHAKPSGGYREPGDDEGLPGPEDGTSVGVQ